MVGSDTYTAWITSTGVVHINDEYASSTLQPLADIVNGGTDDVLHKAGNRVGDVMTYRFARRLKTGDTKDTDLTSLSPIFITYALGDAVPVNGIYQKHCYPFNFEPLVFTDPLYKMCPGQLSASPTTATPTMATTPRLTGPTTSMALRNISLDAITSGAPAYADGTFKLWITVPEQGIKDMAYFTVQAVRTGYVSVGLKNVDAANGNRMTNTDSLTMWVDDTSFVAYVMDETIGSDYSKPKLDVAITANIVAILASSQRNGLTTICFQRPYNTGIEKNIIIPPSGDVGLIFAAGPIDPQKFSSTRINYDQHDVTSREMVVANAATGSSYRVVTETAFQPGQVLILLTCCSLIVYHITFGCLGSYTNHARWAFLYRRVWEFYFYEWIMAGIFVSIVVGAYFVFYKVDSFLRCANLAAGGSVFVVLTGLRNGPLLWILNMSIEKTLYFHRFIARIVICLVILHVALTWKNWTDMNLYPISASWSNWQPNANGCSFLAGFIAFIAALVLLITSFDYVRRNFFNFFLVAHVSSFAIFFIFTYLHMPKVRSDVILAPLYHLRLYPIS